MSELEKVIFQKFDDGIKEIQNGKFIEGLRDVRLVLGSLWFLQENMDAAIVDMLLFVLEPRLKKLKDDKKFSKEFGEALKKIKEGFEKKDELMIYRCAKETVSNVLKLAPTSEEEEE
ncbi:MAG: hypothetical protein QW660_07710 [Candidatus Bathyarchaeia archaeon]